MSAGPGMQLPARLGKYELLEFLGGGMSHVFRARDTVIGRIVAVKILTEAGCADEEAKARFLMEARMAGNIQHDNIINIFDFGEDEQHRPFMVMEFLRGEDLRHAIKNGHTGDLRNKLSVALQVARALEYIHTQKIIHRDIKPENVHITAAGAVKLMDFGIAKTEGMSMTRAGFVLGTPYYMAPEQVLGKEITDLVDVYAFGVLLFELTTGVKPITGDTVERLFYAILNEPLNLDPMQTAGVPQPVCALVTACTAKDPAQRPQGFTPVCAEIQRIMQEMDAAAAPRPVVATPPASRKALLIPLLIGIAILALTGVWYLLRPTLKPTLSTPSGDMVLVPGGKFLFGEKKEAVSLPPFYIDKTEVSNAAYAAFCNATGRALPDQFPSDHPDWPVVRITIVDAQQFARWATKRLPNSHEWEKAARGVDGRRFPWGNDRDPSRANVRDNPSFAERSLRPVTGFDRGASPFGALQTVGNVWELVDQSSAPGPQARDYFTRKLDPPPRADEPWYIIRGGSYDLPLQDNVMYEWSTVPARWSTYNIGFRCVKDP